MLRDAGSIPGSGRFPGGGHGFPLQYSCLKNPMDKGAWQATVYGVAKSWIILDSTFRLWIFFKSTGIRRDLTTNLSAFGLCWVRKWYLKVKANLMRTAVWRDGKETGPWWHQLLNLPWNFRLLVMWRFIFPSCLNSIHFNTLVLTADTIQTKKIFLWDSFREYAKATLK